MASDALSRWMRRRSRRNGDPRLMEYGNNAIEIEIDYGFSFNDRNGKQVAYKRSARSRIFWPVDTGIKARWGFTDFPKRSKVTSSLINGTLVIEVHMRLLVPEKSSPSPFIPENPSACKIIQGLFMNDKSADIVFEVGGNKVKDNAMKVAKTELVLFPAHRCIVENCSSILADMCASRGGDTGESSPIEISGASHDIFRLLLSHIYNVKFPDDVITTHAKEIIDVADRFGVTSLKLEAEANLVITTTFSVEKVKDLLIYADSKNCALQKEAAMDYMLENNDLVLANIRFDNAPGSLVNDVFAAIARAKVRKDDRGAADSDENSASHFHSMRISELRQKVHEKGLDVDGSREMLIASLDKVLKARQS